MDLLVSTYIKLGIISVGIATGYRREQVLTTANHHFWYFLLVAFAGEILDIVMARLLCNNYPYYHVFRPLYYALLTLALSSEMGKLKKTFILSIPITWIIALLNAVYLQPPDRQLNTLIIIISSVLLILQVLFYVAFLFENHNWKETIYHYSFWIAMGILINSISSFLSLGIYNFIEGEGQSALVPILIVSEWLFYGSFIVNFILQKQKAET